MALVFGIRSNLGSPESCSLADQVECRLRLRSLLLQRAERVASAVVLQTLSSQADRALFHSTSITVAADLRLDDRPGLLAFLGESGEPPGQRDDLSLVAAAWERCGEQALRHLTGAFALAIWQPRSQTFWLVRDHAGERPLFYAETSDLLAFASLPSGLIGLPGVTNGIDEQRIIDTLTIFPPQLTSSFLQGIKRIPPGHFLRVTPEHTRLVRYWHPSDVRPLHLQSSRLYEETLVDLLDQATLARLPRVGGVGSQMSGGLDSTSVTASAASLLARRGKSLTAFTAVPRPDFKRRASPGNLIDEGPHAAAVARMYPNIEHVLVDTQGADLLGGAATLTDRMGEPLLNMGNWMWMSKMFDLARDRGITVMLNGSVGNLTLSYDGIRGLRELFRKGSWLRFGHAVRTLRDDGEIGLRSAANFALMGLLPGVLSKSLQPRTRHSLLRHTAIHPRLAARLALDRREYEFASDRDKDTVTERRESYERFDLGAINAGFAAATGVEHRDPTNDRRLWEFSYAVPPEQFLADGHSRSLVRRAMRHRLPPEVVNERRLGLQGADWYTTMREATPELLAEVDRISQSPTACRLLDVDRMRWMLNNWPSESYEQREAAFGWNFALTRAVTLGYFIRSHDPAAIIALEEKAQA